MRTKVASFSGMAFWRTTRPQRCPRYGSSRESTQARIADCSISASPFLASAVETNRVWASLSLAVAANGAGSGADGYRSSITTGESSNP